VPIDEIVDEGLFGTLGYSASYRFLISETFIEGRICTSENCSTICDAPESCICLAGMFNNGALDKTSSVACIISEALPDEYISTPEELTVFGSSERLPEFLAIHCTGKFANCVHQIGQGMGDRRYQ
jgi:hypothetical protein